MSLTRNHGILAVCLILLLSCLYIFMIPASAHAAVTYTINEKSAILYDGDELDLNILKKAEKVVATDDGEEETKTVWVEAKALRVDWNSDCTKVANVDEDGVVKCKNPGMATITADFGKNSFKCKLLVLNPKDYEAKSQKGVTEYDAKKGNAIVKRAYDWIGVGKYQAGACRKGYFDCSGFASYVIAGKRIGNTYTFLSYKHVKDPQPGDICVRSSHAGIYIGSGQMIHAVGTGKGVKMSPVEKGMVYVRIYK